MGKKKYIFLFYNDTYHDTHDILCQRARILDNKSLVLILFSRPQLCMTREQHVLKIDCPW